MDSFKLTSSPYFMKARNYRHNLQLSLGQSTQLQLRPGENKLRRKDELRQEGTHGLELTNSA